MASWETFPAMFKFLQGNVESASPLGQWAAPLFLVWVLRAPAGCISSAGFQSRSLSPREPLGGFHQAKAMSSAGTACKAQIHHGSLHCTNASGNPCRDVFLSSHRENRNARIYLKGHLQMQFIDKSFLSLPVRTAWELWEHGMPGWKANPEHTMLTWHSGFTMWATSIHTHTLDTQSLETRPQGHPTLLVWLKSSYLNR